MKTFIVCAAAAALVIALPKAASACTPTGLIYDKWQDLYGDLGPCVDDATGDGAGGYIETFDYGYVDWISGETAAYAAYGLIGSAWISRYGGPATTGQPIEDEADVAYSADGRISVFESFSTYAKTYIVWNPGTDGTACNTNADNVCEVYGAIGQYWYELQTEISFGDIGLPTDEAYWSDGTHVRQDFRGMYITWNSSNGHTCAFWNDSGGLYSGTTPC